MATNAQITADGITEKLLKNEQLSKAEKAALQGNPPSINMSDVETKIQQRLTNVSKNGTAKEVESVLSKFSKTQASLNKLGSTQTFTNELNGIRERVFENAVTEKTMGEWTELATKQTTYNTLSNGSAVGPYEHMWRNNLLLNNAPEVFNKVLENSPDKDKILDFYEEQQAKGRLSHFDLGPEVNKKFIQYRIEKLKKSPDILKNAKTIEEWRAYREAAKQGGLTIANDVPSDMIMRQLDDTLDKEVIEELADRQDFQKHASKLNQGAKKVFNDKIASGVTIADEARLGYALDNNLLTDDQINTLGDKDLSKMQDKTVQSKLKQKIDAYDQKVLNTKDFDPEKNPRLKQRFETSATQGGMNSQERAAYINNAKEGTFYDASTGQFTETGQKLTQQEKAAYAGRVGNKDLQWSTKHPNLASLKNGQWARNTGDWVEKRLKNPKVSGLGGANIGGIITGLGLGAAVDALVPDRPENAGPLTNAIADTFFGPTGTAWGTGPLEAMKSFAANNAAAKAAGSGILSRAISNPLAAAGGYAKGLFNPMSMAANAVSSLYGSTVPEGELDSIEGALGGLAGGLAAGSGALGILGAMANAGAYAGGKDIQKALGNDAFRDATNLKGNVQDITGDAFEQYNKGYYWNGKVQNRNVIWNTAELKEYIDTMYPNMTAAEREDWIDRHFTAWNPVQVQHLKYSPNLNRYDEKIRDGNHREIDAGFLANTAKKIDANFNAYMDSYKALWDKYINDKDDMLYTDDGRVKSDSEAKQLLKTFIEGERSKQRSNLKLGKTNDKNEDAARVVGMAGLDSKLAQQLVNRQVLQNNLNQGQGDELLQTINAMQQYLQANPEARPVDYFNSL